jgi:thiamine biosynthesis lipoprotein
MKKTKILMGMPITVEIIGESSCEAAIEQVYSYFDYVDSKFSTYKVDSEVSRINRGVLEASQFSSDLKEVLSLCDETNKMSGGYFEIRKDGKIDPSGLVKGWSISNACKLLSNLGYRNFYIDAGGDLEVHGKNGDGGKWIVGIRNPFDKSGITKVLTLGSGGIATSGSYERGLHVYNPKSRSKNDVVSITVVGKDVYEADRFATAAFAMGTEGIAFVEKLHGLEGYMIDEEGIATYTSGFDKYVVNTVVNEEINLQSGNQNVN